MIGIVVAHYLSRSNVKGSESFPVTFHYDYKKKEKGGLKYEKKQSIGA